MPFHLYRVTSEGSPPRWFGIRVEFDDDRWVSDCREVDANGKEKADAPAAAPKFYGVTAEQAHRRMVDVLENSYDEVIPCKTGNSMP